MERRTFLKIAVALSSGAVLPLSFIGNTFSRLDDDQFNNKTNVIVKIETSDRDMFYKMLCSSEVSQDTVTFMPLKNLIINCEKDCLVKNIFVKVPEIDIFARLPSDFPINITVGEQLTIVFNDGILSLT